ARMALGAGAPIGLFSPLLPLSSLMANAPMDATSMTRKGGPVLFVSASWVAPIALAGAFDPGSDRLACPQDAPPLCAVAQSSLAQAESAVAAAAARKALWSTA